MNDLERLRNELNDAINALTQTAMRLKSSAREAVEKRSDYEERKNGYLIQLAAEDAESGTKRTVALQQAMYRQLYKNERRAYLLAEADLDSDKDLFRGIQAKLNALQTVSRLTESEVKLGVNFQ